MEAIVLLYNNDYNKGAAALINSLIHHSYKGLVCIGYDGNALPHWTDQLTRSGDNVFIYQQLTLRFYKINSEIHPGYYKPYFISAILNEDPSIKKIYFFDTDICVIAPWSYFSDWVEYGIALCADQCYPQMNSTHPWKKEFAKMLGKEINPAMDYYVNSGFIGLQTADKKILEEWISATEVLKNKMDLTAFHKEPYRAFKGDQDILNAVLLTGDYKVSLAGPESMGFSEPASYMLHATSNPKPWNRNFLFDLFRSGAKPTQAEKAYLRFANMYIRSIPSSALRMKKWNIKIASVLSRILA